MDNLPPGVSASSIPGNTDDDEWWEAFVVELGDRLPAWTSYHSPYKVAEMVGRILQAYNGIYAEAFEAGKREAVMDALEEADPDA